MFKYPSGEKYQQRYRISHIRVKARSQSENMRKMCLLPWKLKSYHNTTTIFLWGSCERKVIIEIRWRFYGFIWLLSKCYYNSRSIQHKPRLYDRSIFSEHEIILFARNTHTEVHFCFLIISNSMKEAVRWIVKYSVFGNHKSLWWLLKILYFNWMRIEGK